MWGIVLISFFWSGRWFWKMLKYAMFIKLLLYSLKKILLYYFSYVNPLYYCTKGSSINYVEKIWGGWKVWQFLTRRRSLRLFEVNNVIFVMKIKIITDWLMKLVLVIVISISKLHLRDSFRHQFQFSKLAKALKGGWRSVGQKLQATTFVSSTEISRVMSQDYS